MQYLEKGIAGVLKIGAAFMVFAGILIGGLLGCDGASSGSRTERPRRIPCPEDCLEVAEELASDLTPESLQRLIERYGSLEAATQRLNECAELKRAGCE